MITHAAKVLALYTKSVQFSCDVVMINDPMHKFKDILRSIKGELSLQYMKTFVVIALTQKQFQTVNRMNF